MKNSNAGVATINLSQIPFIESLRGIAISLVVVFHAVYHAFKNTELPFQGWWRSFDVSKGFLLLTPFQVPTGVSLFIVISGFCIHLSYSRLGNVTGWQVFLRRFFRIYPPYLVSLLIFSFLFPWTDYGLNSWRNVWQFASHVLMIHNLDVKTVHAINAVYWFVAVEVQLLLVYPFLRAFAQRYSWNVLLLLMAIVEITARLAAGYFNLNKTLGPYAADQEVLLILTSPFAYCFCWTLGASIAEWARQGTRLPAFFKVSPWIWAALMIVVWMFKPTKYLTEIFAAITAGVIIARLLANNAVDLPLPKAIRAPFHSLGKHGYGVYLLHAPIQSAFIGILAHWSHAVMFDQNLQFFAALGALVAILPAAWVFHKLVEVPSTNIGRKLSRPRSGPTNSSEVFAKTSGVTAK